MLTAEASQQRRWLRLPALSDASSQTAHRNQKGEADPCHQRAKRLVRSARLDVTRETLINDERELQGETLK